MEKEKKEKNQHEFLLNLGLYDSASQVGEWLNTFVD